MARREAAVRHPIDSKRAIEADHSAALSVWKTILLYRGRCYFLTSVVRVRKYCDRKGKIILEIWRIYTFWTFLNTKSRFLNALCRVCVCVCVDVCVCVCVCVCICVSHASAWTFARILFVFGV
jgi:hypothetical protein